MSPKLWPKLFQTLVKALVELVAPKPLPEILELLPGFGQQVFYILEGDFREVKGLPYGALVSAYVNAALLEDVDVIRTASIHETKYVLVSLAKKCQTMSKNPSRGLASKRKKDGDVETIWIRQLTCVPTISESIAVALLNHFGTLSDLREALRDPLSFPVVPLSRSASLGKARIAKLAEVLLQ